MCRCLLDAGLGKGGLSALCSHRALPDIVHWDSYLFHHLFTKPTFPSATSNSIILAEAAFQWFNDHCINYPITKMFK